MPRRPSWPAAATSPASCSEALADFREVGRASRRRRRRSRHGSSLWRYAPRRGGGQANGSGTLAEYSASDISSRRSALGGATALMCGCTDNGSKMQHSFRSWVANWSACSRPAITCSWGQLREGNRYSQQRGAIEIAAWPRRPRGYERFQRREGLAASAQHTGQRSKVKTAANSALVSSPLVILPAWRNVRHMEIRVLTSCSAASGWLASVQVRSTELPRRLHSALFATNTSSHQPQALSQLANQQHSSNGDADEPRVHTAVPGDLPRRPSGDTRAPRAHGRPRRGDPLDNRSYSPAQPAPVCGLCCDRISIAHRVPHAFRVLATGNVLPSPITLL